MSFILGFGYVSSAHDIFQASPKKKCTQKDEQQKERKDDILKCFLGHQMLQSHSSETIQFNYQKERVVCPHF